MELEKRGLATTELKWYFSLLACSDWIFVISSKGAVDYGHQRFSYAYKRFSALAEMVELESQNQKVPKRILAAVQEARAYQPIPSALHRNESSSEKITLQKEDTTRLI